MKHEGKVVSLLLRFTDSANGMIDGIVLNSEDTSVTKHLRPETDNACLPA